MNGEGFAFFRWVSLNAEKYHWNGEHGWDCNDCRIAWKYLKSGGLL